MPNSNYKLSVEKRLTRVEDKVDDLGCDVKEIKDNHLPHIQADIENLKKYLWMAIGAIAVIEFIFRYVLK
jgi:hypothetical protein